MHANLIDHNCLISTHSNPLDVTNRRVCHAQRCKCLHRAKTRSQNVKLNLRVLSNPTLYIFIACNCLLLTQIASADDSNAAPQFDLGALANIASSLGSNPQVVNLVSSFLNQGNSGSGSGGQRATPSGVVGANTGEPPIPELDAGGVIVPIPEDPTAAPAASAQTNEAPVRRGAKQLATGASQPSPNQPTQRPSVAPVSNPIGGNLGSLMSMLPNVMPNLNLGGLLGNLVKPPNQAQQATSAAPDQQVQPQPQPQQQQQQQQQPAPQRQALASSRSGLQSTSIKPQSTQTQATNAQSVINQVLTAYASGQIPNELIQLGLSGRVPPQIIELALSGQVPPQMIQMVITGQVPMTTINTFLETIKQPAEAAGGSRMSKPIADQPQPPQSQHQQHQFGSGVLGTTRAVFEALFNKSHLNPKDVLPNGSNQSGGSSLSVPTLLGPIPLPMPKFPTARKIGQFVGGTISSMASMIPS